MNKATVFLMGVLLVMPFPVKAQSAAGQISGYIRDPSGAGVPEVEIEARELQAERTYVSRSDSTGAYEFLRVPPGSYEIYASYRGFQPARSGRVTLSGGQAVGLDLVLEIEKGQQSITVVGEAAPLDVSSPHLSQIVNETSFTSLPVNGRSLEQLALLAPGMLLIRGKDKRSLNGLTEELSANGSRGIEYALDGADLQHPILKSTPGGVSGLFLGVDTVQEFEILKDAYPAYLGGSGGALVNVISRRGTREFHGSVFEFYRDSALDARNFFDVDFERPAERSDPPPFDRHQYGGSIGGPLPGRENAFLFSYEGMRERLGLTLINSVPTESTRQGILPDGPVPVSDDIRPILDLYPLPNGQDFGDGVGEYRFQQSQPTDDQHFSARTDFRLSTNDSMFIRYTFHDSQKVAPFTTSIEGFDSDLSSRNQYLTVEETHVFSPRFLNTLQFSYNRGQFVGFSSARGDLAAAPALVPGRKNVGRINIRGLNSFGTDTADVDFPFDQFQISDSFHFSSKRHDLRWGLDWKHYRSAGSYNFFFDGLLVYENLEDFLTNSPQRFIGAAADADALRRYRQDLFAFYIHDQLSLWPDLTLSYGVRYQPFTVPSEADGKISNLRSLLDPAPTVGDPLFDNPSHLNFAPRIGLAWNLQGRGRTVVRTGFGVFHEPVRENIFGYRVRVQSPFMTVRTIIRPPYPDPLGGGRAGQPRQDNLQFDLSTPYMMRYHLLVQQMLVKDLVLRAGYFGSRGVHLPRVGDINVPGPVSVEPDGRLFFGNQPGPRPNSNLDAVRLTSTDANSVYNSFQLGLSRRWADGLQFEFNYTWSRSIDDSSAYRRESINSLAEPPYALDRTAERGLSDFHTAQNAVLQGTWDLPVDLPGGSLTGILLNDWRLAGILTLSDGFPFTANVSFDIANNRIREGHRPDLVPGASNNPVLGGPDEYFDVGAFQLQDPGHLGTLGRNTLISPGFAAVDVTASRTVSLTEGHHLEFRVEIFNLLNRANFSMPQNRGAGGGVVLFTSLSGEPSGNAAKIFQTTGSSRQIQLGARLRF